MTQRDKFEKWFIGLDDNLNINQFNKELMFIAGKAATKAAVLEWISVENKTPEHEPGKWSDPVIAMSDIGLVFRLSYCGGWQRTGDFMSTGSSKVTHWIPMPKFAEDDNVS